MEKLNINSLRKNIDKIAQYDFSKNKVFGSSYYVYQDGGFGYGKCYGTVSAYSDIPVTENTIFRLASMTKPITAVATLILAEKGLLSPDDTVDKFLPEFKNILVIDEFGNRKKTDLMPTVRNILSHSSGIASNFEKLSDMTKQQKETLDDSIDYYIKKGLDFEPGTAQMYSPTGAFDVLVKIIEKVSETDYPSFLQKMIFEPLDMRDTTFSPNREQEKRMVKMHQIIDGENAEFKMPDGCVFEDYPYERYLGGAGLVSTISDYSKFAKMFLNGGKGEKKRILSEKTLNQLSTPQVPKEIMTGLERWGLGVRVITEDNEPNLPKGTFGWSGAYGSHFWIDPQNRIFAVFMKNSKFDGGSGNESARNFEKAVYSSFENRT